MGKTFKHTFNEQEGYKLTKGQRKKRKKQARHRKAKKGFLRIIYSEQAWNKLNDTSKKSY